MAPSRLTPGKLQGLERQQTILERASQGDRLADIAHDSGLSYERVRQLARRVWPEREIALRAKAQEVRRRVEAGEAAANIARGLNVSERQVRGVVRHVAELQHRPRVVSYELRKEIIASARSGKSYADIARETGLSLSGVRNICRKFVGRRQKQPFDRERAFELYRAGLHDSAIADQLGYSVMAIRGWRERSGLRRNVKRRRSHDGL